MTIHCLQCKKNIGKIKIGDLGRVIYLEENGILSVRLRMDGVYGFQCKCGNDTRLAAAERGIIKAHRPTRKEVQTVLARLTKPEIKKGKSNLDIETFRVSGNDHKLLGGQYA